MTEIDKIKNIVESYSPDDSYLKTIRVMLEKDKRFNDISYLPIAFLKEVLNKDFILDKHNSSEFRLYLRETKYGGLIAYLPIENTFYYTLSYRDNHNVFESQHDLNKKWSVYGRKIN